MIAGLASVGAVETTDRDEAHSLPGTGFGAASEAVSYDRQIRPLLSDRCFICHGPDGERRQADLRLDDPASATADRPGPRAIFPGWPDQSEVWRRITADDPEFAMPPPDSNRKPLSADEKLLIRRWIEQGANYEPHWSFVPPRRPLLPAVKAANWPRNPIDTFVLAKLEANRLTPSAPADRATLLRRLFLDLTGLPPTTAEMDAFLADPQPDAFERRVDRIMNEEPYRSRMAERLSLPWLDAARYADTCGIHTDGGRQQWPWRDWVLRAFRDNMPFDQFVVEQIAGDLLPGATLDQKVASGFNRNHVTTDEGGAIAEEYLVEYAVDRATTTASALLGLTLGCARCHDHKFDPISQAEFYGFYAFFNSVDEPGLYSQTPDSNRAYEPFISVPRPEQTEAIARARAEVKVLARKQQESSPKADEERRAFDAALPKELSLSWEEPRVVSARSSGGADLALQPDRSILASGKNPDRDVQEITLDVPRGGDDLRLVLLEALGDPSLPFGRVGRSPNGNAVVTGVEVESAETADPGHARKIPVQWIWADVVQPDGDFGPTNVLRGAANTDRGWAVDAHRQAGNRRLMVLTAEPLAKAGPAQVVVRIRYESIYAQHAFGRVRLSLGRLADASRLPVATSDWYAVGPIPPDSDVSVYDRAFGPETATRLDLKKNFGFGNRYWSRRPDVEDGVANGLAGGTGATYLGREIYSPTARKLDVGLGSDDGFRLFVNGKEVAGKNIDRSLKVDEDQATIDLQPGLNFLVMKIVNTGGDAGVYFRQKPAAAVLPHDLAAALLPGFAVTQELSTRMARAWRVAFSSEFREREERIAALGRDIADTEAKIPKAMVMKELPMARATFVLTRGQYDKPDRNRPVTRGIPAALGKIPAGTTVDRLALARWLVSKDNPLVARVAVNRWWEALFGAGLVRTSEDFGSQGESPTHAELLDWLAVEYRESGWDTRKLVRSIVTSATYQQSSTVRKDVREVDPDNRLLAVYPARRLGAEQLRDQALYLSGLLVERFGGPSVKPYQPPGLWQEVAMPASNTRIYEQDSGEGLWRRSLYTYWKRAAPPPSLLTFDAPTRESCVIRRSSTSTPLQALVLWNDPQFVEASRVLAARALKGATSDEARLATLHRSCTGAEPDSRERAALAQALDGFRRRFRASPKDASALIGVGMAPAATDVDPAELAAWTMVASAELNLYRTTTNL